MPNASAHPTMAAQQSACLITALLLLKLEMTVLSLRPRLACTANELCFSLFRRRLHRGRNLRSSPRTQTPQALYCLECTEFPRFLVPLTRLLDVWLQTDDLHLGKLIGIVSARERHGALR